MQPEHAHGRVQPDGSLFDCTHDVVKTTPFEAIEILASMLYIHSFRRYKYTRDYKGVAKPRVILLARSRCRRSGLGAL